MLSLFLVMALLGSMPGVVANVSGMVGSVCSFCAGIVAGVLLSVVLVVEPSWCAWVSVHAGCCCTTLNQAHEHR